MTPSHHSSETRNRPSPSCGSSRTPRRGRRPAGRVVQAGHPRGAGERLDAGQRRALQDEEGRQRHQEAGQPGVHHEHAVDDADEQRGTPARRSSAGQVSQPACSISSAVTRRARDGHHADRQVELAGDQQQRDRHPADAQRCGDVEDAGQAADGEQPGRLHGEERDHAQERRPAPAGSAGPAPAEQPAAARGVAAAGVRPSAGRRSADHRRQPGGARDVGSGASSTSGVPPSVHDAPAPAVRPQRRRAQGCSSQRTRSSAYQVQR